jgi:hypothetical protein
MYTLLLFATIVSQELPLVLASKIKDPPQGFPDIYNIIKLILFKNV